MNYRKLNNPRATKQIVPAQKSRPATTAETAQRELSAYAIAMMTGEALVHDVPELLKQAKESPEWPQWEHAIQTELDQLRDRGTWEMMDLPKGRNVIGSQFTFEKKFDTDGNLSRYKARLVAKGYSQIPGQDFNSTYSPVM